jgi:hypothetical protein
VLVSTNAEGTNQGGTLKGFSRSGVGLIPNLQLTLELLEGLILLVKIHQVAGLGRQIRERAEIFSIHEQVDLLE